MPRISFGKVEKIGDKQVLIGSNTNLDTKALIDAKLSVSQSRVQKIEDKVKFENEKVAAINKLQDLTNKLAGTLDGLRYKPGILNLGDNAFSSRTSTTSSKTSSSNNGVKVIAKNNAPIGQFEIEVTQIATEKVQQSKAFSAKNVSVVNAVAGADAAKFNPGTFKLNGVDVTLSSNDSLLDIADKINLLSKQTNVKAIVVSPLSNQHRLILSSTLTGDDGNYQIVDTDNILNTLFPESTLKSPSNAKFKYEGVLEVERSSNTIDDFIENTTIQLSQSTIPGEKLTVEIKSDLTTIRAYISDFINNYNELIKFIEQQQLKDENGKYLESSILGRENILSVLSYGLNSLITSYVEGDVALSNLAEIGIEMMDFPEPVEGKEDNVFKNLLAVNAEKLDGFLNNQFNDVRKVFELDFYSSSGHILPGLVRGNSLNVNQFSMDININKALEDIVKISYQQNGNTVDVKATFSPYSESDLTKGGKIAGIPGTILEGFEFNYVGSGVEIINVNITQGVADKIYNFLNVLKSQDFFDNAKEAILENVERNKSEVKKINSQIETERENLLAKFSKLESDIAKANSIIAGLDAQMEAAKR